MINNKTKKTVFITASVILISVVLGRYVIVPLTVFKATWSVEFACGLLGLACITEFVSIIAGILMNMRKCLILAVATPKTDSEISEIGIESPVDFAFAMCNILAYKRTPVFCILETLSRPSMFSSPIVFKKSMALFEERFGRKPLGYQTRDWDRILCLESAEVLKKDADDVRVAETLDQVSEEVLNRFRIKRLSQDEDKAA